MKEKFNCEIGFSDHSKNLMVAEAASKAGATIFEKHICLKNVKSLDYEFSISQDQISLYKKSYYQTKFKFYFYKKLLGKKALLGEKLKK